MALVVGPRVGHADPPVVLPVPASEDFADLFRTAFRLLSRRGLVPAVEAEDRVDVRAVPTADAAAHGVDLERLLTSMPPRRRACVVLCWLLEAPTSEAAAALGIADGTVRKHLDAARRQIADGL